MSALFLRRLNGCAALAIRFASSRSTLLSTIEASVLTMDLLCSLAIGSRPIEPNPRCWDQRKGLDDRIHLNNSVPVYKVGTRPVDTQPP